MPIQSKATRAKAPAATGASIDLRELIDEYEAARVAAEAAERDRVEAGGEPSDAEERAWYKATYDPLYKAAHRLRAAVLIACGEDPDDMQTRRAVVIDGFVAVAFEGSDRDDSADAILEGLIVLPPDAARLL